MGAADTDAPVVGVIIKGDLIGRGAVRIIGLHRIALGQRVQHLAGGGVGGFGVALGVGDHAVHLVMRLLGAGVGPNLNGDRGGFSALLIRNRPIEVLDGFGVAVLVGGVIPLIGQAIAHGGDAEAHLDGTELVVPHLHRGLIGVALDGDWLDVAAVGALMGAVVAVRNNITLGFVAGAAGEQVAIVVGCALVHILPIQIDALEVHVDGNRNFTGGVFHHADKTA